MHKKRYLIVIIFVALALVSLGVTSAKTTKNPQGDELNRLNTNAEMKVSGLLSVSEFASEEEPMMSGLVYRIRYWLIAIGILLIFGMIWIFSLNHLVMTKTKALYDSNERLGQTQGQNKAIINAIPDVIFILDNETRVKDYKDDGFEMTFYDRTELIGKKLSELIPEPYGNQLLEQLKNVVSLNTLRTLEFQIQDGETQKYFELRLMRSNINETVALLRDMTSHFEKLENIRFLSYHDQLTGLYNRYMFEEELSRLNVPRNLPLSVVMADVNGLKLVNDCFGHTKGDELLKSFSGILKKTFREDDLICRVGGDEFIIILPKTSSEVAEQLIERIEIACHSYHYLNVSLSAAFGSATKLNSEDSIKVALKSAEDKMYKRKLFEAPVIKEQMVDKLLKSLFLEIKVEESHAQDVQKYSLILGEAIQLNSSELSTLENASLYHDVGKIAINHEILEKSGALTTDEMTLLKTHPDIGYRILSVVNDMSECADIILAHHERWDGTGYPMGLCGEEIPLLSRIVTIADAFSAMTNKSLYKETMTVQEALEEIERYSGTQFDPILGRKFAQIMRIKM